METPPDNENSGVLVSLLTNFVMVESMVEKAYGVIVESLTIKKYPPTATPNPNPKIKQPQPQKP